MKKTPNKRASGASARKCPKVRPGHAIGNLDNLSGPELKRLFHELDTYQIELEMQNDELRRVQQDLETARRRYAALYDFAPIGYFTFDKRGVILDVNITGAAMLGVNKREIFGTPFVRFISDREDRTAFARHCVEVLRSGSGPECELRITKKGGDFFDALLKSVPSGDEGETGSFTTVVVDITDRKKAENALRSSEERYRVLFENAMDAIFVIDIEGERAGRIVAANPAAAEMHGYSVDELLTLKITDLDSPEAAIESPALISRILKGERINKEITHRRKDGTVFPVEINANLLDLGNQKYILAIDRDITRRQQAQKALRESEERLRFHMEHSPMAVVEWDRDFVVTRWAGEAERMFGWSAGEIIGRPIADLKIIYEEDIPIVRGVMVRLTSGSRHVVSSNRNYTKDGRVIHCTWYNSVLTDEDGEMASVMSLVLDITDRKRAEEQVLRHMEELRASNEELTRLNHAMVDRELRMIELKREVNELCSRAGLPQKYSLDFVQEETNSSLNPGEPSLPERGSDKTK